VTQGHITNYAQNQDGLVWSLHQLQQHLGVEVWGELWGKMKAACGRAVAAAAVTGVREAQREGQVPQDSCFELLGE
jgi:hypothetical protein